MKRAIPSLVLVGLAVWLVCVSLAGAPTSLEDVAEAIADGVGDVLLVNQADPDCVIFVFEERHDSILAQIEIAIMLNRAYRTCGTRCIGLEGLARTEGPLDLSWAHRSPPYRPDEPVTNREDVIAHTLFQGEIGAGEMMGLIYEDVVVAGIDDAALYAVTASDDIWSAPFNYLYNIAVAEMSSTEYSRWKRLYDQKQYPEAEEYAIGTNAFAEEFYDRLTDEINGPSAEEMLEIYSLLRSRARRANVTLPSETQHALLACIQYLEIVSQRSDAMVSTALSLASTSQGIPLAINVGFMHTERTEQLLMDAGASFVVFRSQSHASGTEAGLLSQEALERKAGGLSVGGEGHIGRFLDGRKKPEVTCTKWWYGTEEAIAEVMQFLAYACYRAAEEGDETWDSLDLNAAMANGEIRINGMPISEFLHPFGILSLEVVGQSLEEDASGGIRSTVVDTVIIVRNPDTGKETELHGEATFSSETSAKGGMTLEELLGLHRETVLGPTEPSPEEEKVEAVQTCSDTTIIWKGA